MKSKIDRIGMALSIGVAIGAVSATLACAHVHRPRPTTHCIAVEGAKDFCISPGCTIKRGGGGFDLSCPSGLIGHFRLNDSRDL